MTTPTPPDMPELKSCAECGMFVTPTEYHPYAACLMFKACGNSGTVRSNLNAVISRPTPPADAQQEILEDYRRLREYIPVTPLPDGMKPDILADLKRFIARKERAALSAPSREAAMLRGQLGGKQMVINQLERREKELMGCIRDLNHKCEVVANAVLDDPNINPIMAATYRHVLLDNEKHAALIAEAKGEK